MLAEYQIADGHCPLTAPKIEKAENIYPGPSLYDCCLLSVGLHDSVDLAYSAALDV